MDVTAETDSGPYNWKGEEYPNRIRDERSNGYYVEFYDTENQCNR